MEWWVDSGVFLFLNLPQESKIDEVCGLNPCFPLINAVVDVFADHRKISTGDVSIAVGDFMVSLALLHV